MSFAATRALVLRTTKLAKTLKADIERGERDPAVMQVQLLELADVVDDLLRGLLLDALNGL